MCSGQHGGRPEIKHGHRTAQHDPGSLPCTIRHDERDADGQRPLQSCSQCQFASAPDCALPPGADRSEPEISCNRPGELASRHGSGSARDFRSPREVPVQGQQHQGRHPCRRSTRQAAHGARLLRSTVDGLQATSSAPTSSPCSVRPAIAAEGPAHQRRGERVKTPITLVRQPGPE
jgi:hypothetical protein